MDLENVENTLIFATGNVFRHSNAVFLNQDVLLLGHVGS